jgi:hypothetical protein
MKETLLLFLSNHIIVVLFFSLHNSGMKNIEYLLKVGSDTEFVFSWDQNCLPGRGNTKGTTMDYISAIQSLNKNAVQPTEECKYVLTFKLMLIFSSSI